MTEGMDVQPATTNLNPGGKSGMQSRTQSHTAAISALEGFTSYEDFRDISEELMYLFCSLAMSNAFSVDQMCNHVLPMGKAIM